MKRIIPLILIVIIFFSLTSCKNKSPYDYRTSDSLTVYFFDVGQADSSLLIFPDNTIMLIDCGNSADADKLTGFIGQLGIKTIDYLILTHPHEDHIGGALKVFENFNVSTFCFPEIDNSVDFVDERYNKTLAAANDEKCELLPLTAGTIMSEKENYSITAISPVENCIYSDLNDYSLSLIVTCYTNTILFTGDMGAAAEMDVLKQNFNIRADLLKVGHHGSNNSTTLSFLEATKPQVAVISSGRGNSYGHPSSELLMRLSDRNIKSYRTDSVGTVIARLYDGGFNIVTDKNIDLDGN